MSNPVIFEMALKPVPLDQEEQVKDAIRQIVDVFTRNATAADASEIKYHCDLERVHICVLFDDDREENRQSFAAWVQSQADRIKGYLN